MLCVRGRSSAAWGEDPETEHPAPLSPPSQSLLEKRVPPGGGKDGGKDPFGVRDVRMAVPADAEAQAILERLEQEEDDDDDGDGSSPETQRLRRSQPRPSSRRRAGGGGSGGTLRRPQGQGRHTGSASKSRRSRRSSSSEEPEDSDSDSIEQALPAMAMPRLSLVQSQAWPRAPGASAWDWPLSRRETSERLVMIDRQVLLIDRWELAEKLDRLRGCGRSASVSGKSAARSSGGRLSR